MRRASLIASAARSWPATPSSGLTASVVSKPRVAGSQRQRSSWMGSSCALADRAFFITIPSLLSLLCTAAVFGPAGLGTHGLCFRLRKILAAAPDPDLPEMHSEQIEMDDPFVPPAVSATRRPGRQIGRRSSRERLLLRLEKALT